MCKINSHRKSSDQRRGATLLFVISLIVIFTLAGTVFLSVATSFAKRAERASRDDSRSVPGNNSSFYGSGVVGRSEHTEDALYELLRGSVNASSTIAPHSLLGDKYDARQGFKGSFVIPNSPPTSIPSFGLTWPPVAPGGSGNVQLVAGTQGHFVDIAINWSTALTQNLPRTSNPSQIWNPSNGASPFPLSPLNDFYAGCELFLVAGNQASPAMRIVKYENNYSNTNFGPNQQQIFRCYVPADFAFDAQPTHIIVNSRPYTGLGAGLAANGLVTDEVFRVNRTVANGNEYDRAGLNESYDAPDHQNMFLGAVIPTGNASRPYVVIPSFHRPALINFAQSNGLTPAQVELIPRNPGFDPNSRPPLAATYNLATQDPNELWQVDNDQDLINDSVWVDAGLPIETAPDGTVVKPLVSYLVLDLDGRLNVNAHGSDWHINRQTGDPMMRGRALLTTTPGLIQQGIGYGPPEIALNGLFDANFGATPQLLELVRGRYGLAGDGLPGVPNYLDEMIRPIVQEFPPTSGLLSAFMSPEDLQGRKVVTTDLSGNPVYEYAPPGSNEIFDSPYELDLHRKKNTVDTPYTLAELEAILRPIGADVDKLPQRLKRLLTSNVMAPREMSRVVTTDSWEVPTPPALPLAQGQDPSQRAVTVTQRYSQLRLQRLVAGGVNQQQAVQLVAQEVALLFPTEMIRGEKFDLNRPFGDGRDTQGIETSGNFANSVVDEARGWLRQDNPALGPVGTPALWPSKRQSFTDLPASPFVNAGNKTVQVQHFDESVFAQGVALQTPSGTQYNMVYDFDQDGVVVGDLTEAYKARPQMALHLYMTMMTLLQDAQPFPQLDYDGDGQASEIETAYVVAQWAVNVVDFRDADSIMTAFEFDPTPFSGDANDVLVSTPSGLAPRLDGEINFDAAAGYETVGPNRGLVWGAERPELLITEAVAWHDRRTEDLSAGNGSVGGNGNGMANGNANGNANGGGNNDDDYDQRLLPAGGAFVELYNPWDNAYSAPGELYANRNGVTGLDITQVNVFGSPVWRFAIADLDLPQSAGMNQSGDGFIDRYEDRLDPNLRLIMNPTNTPIEPRSQLVPQNAIDWDRFVYFTSPAIVAPGDLPENSGNAFFLSEEVRRLINPIPPKQHAVVGSAQRREGGGANASYATYVGRIAQDPLVLEVDENSMEYDQTQSIILRPGQNQVIANLTRNASTREAVAIPVDGWQAGTVDLASNNDDQVTRRWFTISEPISTDYLTLAQAQDPTNTRLVGSPVPWEQQLLMPVDEPLDQRRTDITDNDKSRLENDGTYLSYRVLFLQRLANPLMPWDPVRNPYISVDRHGFDLTTFNGVVNDADDPDNNPSSGTSFQAFERGDKEPPAGPKRKNIWRWEPLVTTNNAPSGVNNFPQFDDRGYRDVRPQRRQRPDPAFGHHFNFSLDETFGRVSDEWTQLTANNIPAPWLAWNNRPFVSHLELVNVPIFNAWRLLREYDMSSGGEDASYSTTANYRPFEYGNQDFPHLVNLYQSRTGIPANAQSTPIEMHRILDYVHVPSRFTGGYDYLNPNVFDGTNVNHAGFLPPYNRIPHFRQPGKININTIYAPGVWNSVLAGYNDPQRAAMTWNELQDQRRGVNVGSGSAIFANVPGFPSYFNNPWRSAAMGRLFSNRVIPSAANYPPEVDSGWLRRQRAAVDNTMVQNSDDPLLQRELPQGLQQQTENSLRNNYHRYDTLTRLGNLTTTQSNVFAVWITVGYFEADPGTGLPLREVGAEANARFRRRGFYIVDRSVPVPYEPGSKIDLSPMIKVHRELD